MEEVQIWSWLKIINTKISSFQGRYIIQGILDLFSQMNWVVIYFFSYYLSIICFFSCLFPS